VEDDAMNSKYIIQVIPISLSEKEGWRATLPVPVEWQHLPGVMGQQSKDGPWIGGEGSSSTAALDALIYAIGRATLGAMQRDAVSQEKSGSMKSQWWHVKDPMGPEFFVLVVEGRIAAFPGGRIFWIGQLCSKAKEDLELQKFVCTEAAAR
jgi:hypothetical protein